MFQPQNSNEIIINILSSEVKARGERFTSEEATLTTVNCMCSLQNKGHSGKFSQVDFQLQLSVVYLEQKLTLVLEAICRNCVLSFHL